MEINKTLMIERLKKLRQEKGFSQTEASDYVGAGTGTWQQWEIGQRIQRECRLYMRDDGPAHSGSGSHSKKAAGRRGLGNHTAVFTAYPGRETLYSASA